MLAVNSVDKIAQDKQIISQAVAAKQQELKAAGQWQDQSDKEIEELTKPIWAPQMAERPFLSANDRSRWLQMRALVEEGTFAIEDFVADPIANPNWDCIDMVMHLDAAGAPHLYSSKPPLLATLYAGPYWVACKIGSAIAKKPVNLGTNPYEIGRTLVVLLNVVPLVIYFFVMAGIVDRYGKTDWGRIFVMAAATLGTFLTTFAVSLNNHLPAAVCAAITISATMAIWYRGDRRWRTYAVCGLFAALAAAFELPATSLLAAVAVGLLWKTPRQMLLGFLPGTLVVAAGSFATNWLAHGSVIPPYAHRVHGEKTGASFSASDEGGIRKAEGGTSAEGAAANATGQRPISSPPTQTTTPAANAPANDGSRAVTTASGKFEGKKTLPSGKTISMSGDSSNWYDYEFTRTDGKLVQSYWRDPKGIDSGEASVGKYALNLLIGHHGIFSLTPIWLLAIPGLGLLWFAKDYRMPGLASAIGLISVVCIVFYILRPMDERNYGGMTSGFRWVFWLAPLWFVAMVPMADKLAGGRFRRGVGYLLLGMSVVAASYPVWNPWSSPYLQSFWTYMGW